MRGSLEQNTHNFIQINIYTWFTSCTIGEEESLLLNIHLVNITVVVYIKIFPNIHLLYLGPLWSIWLFYLFIVLFHFILFYFILFKSYFFPTLYFYGQR